METEENRKETVLRDEKGLFLPGTAPGPGLPPQTEEEKVVKKAQKEFIQEYKEKLSEALPLISPILIAKALEGDMTAIKEINDRAMGKAPQDITSGGEKIQQVPIYAGLSQHQSNQEDIQPQEEN